MFGRYSREHLVVSYRVKKLLGKSFRSFLWLLLAFFVYLVVFNRALVSRLLPRQWRSLQQRAGDLYRKDICQKFSLEGLVFANSAKVEQKISDLCRDTDFNLEHLKSSLLEDPWIKKLYIRRSIDSGLAVTLVEYSPFALFTSDYSDYILVDEFGDRINIPSEEISFFSYLFTIVDKNFDSEEINRLFNILSLHYGVARDISAFIRQGDRRWDLKLKNGILVKMPESNSDFIGAWTILEVLLAVQGLAVDLGEIDLRIGGWAILKYRNGVKNEIDKFFGYKIIANNEGT